MNGDVFPLKAAISRYMHDFYNRLYPDTPAMQEFTGRGIERSVMWVPGRMIDAAEDMLAAYQRNDNSNTPNAGARLPVILCAMSKDFIPTSGSDGGRQVSRQLVSFTDEPDASVYGYRQAMGDVRVQVVICAPEEATAKSLAAQFSMWVADYANRYLTTQHKFGQYTIELSNILETPDILFQNVATDRKNMTMLAADITIKSLMPYFDAPRVGEPNDGTDRNPPGYPVVTGVNVNGHPSVGLQVTNCEGSTGIIVLQDCDESGDTVVLSDFRLTIDEW